jgi:exonuclease VII large subunit
MTAAVCLGECLPVERAKDNIGRNSCVSGKVVKVAQSQSGNYFLDFCENYRECPFTVVVFQRNLRDVGDIRALEGGVVNVHGKIKEYGGRAEIVLDDARQLKGLVAKLPPLPKNFDVEKRGTFSPGQKPKHSKPDRKTYKRQPRELPDVEDE